MSKKQKFNSGYWLDCDFDGGACWSYENSLKHIQVGQECGKMGNYGFAVSHLVLGSEELIKALVLICLYGDQHFINDQQKESMFRDHTFKHINISEFFNSLTEDSHEDFDQNIFEYYANPQNARSKFQYIGLFLSKRFDIGIIAQTDLKDIEDMLSQANDLKNRGFYVDYKSNWILPEDIRAEQYLKFLAITNKLLRFIEPIFKTSLTDERLMDFLNRQFR